MIFKLNSCILFLSLSSFFQDGDYYWWHKSNANQFNLAYWRFMCFFLIKMVSRLVRIRHSAHFFLVFFSVVVLVSIVIAFTIINARNTREKKNYINALFCQQVVSKFKSTKLFYFWAEKQNCMFNAKIWSKEFFHLGRRVIIVSCWKDRFAWLLLNINPIWNVI